MNGSNFWENQGWRIVSNGVVMGATLLLDDLDRQGFKLRSVNQVHGACILDDSSYSSPEQEADGLITDKKEVLLVIRTADCVPVHLSSGGRLGMIHAGWRSVRAGIIGRLSTYFPEGGIARIGPCISAANYEVNQDLYGDWVKNEPEVADFLSPSQTSNTHRFFDLSGLVRHQLEQLDFEVGTLPLCTFASELPSFRRNRTTERIFNYIGQF